MAFTIGIIGTGYVGLVSGTCFAETGNSVICVDIDEKKIEKLRAGKTPIYEPGLEYLLERNIREKRLTFTTNLAEAVEKCTFLFLCLPTPPDEDGSADLHYVIDVAKKIGEIITEKKITDFRVIINKSTVPVGTSEKVRSALRSTAPDGNFEVVSNPEFLREGFAVDDCLKPDRVVVGTSNERCATAMRDLYEPFTRSGNPIFIVKEKSAELIKYAGNSFLAMRISFMNELSAYCEKIGADIDDVRVGIGADSRIGKRFLFAGIGYGGSCFPKDVRALLHSTKEAGTPLGIMQSVELANHNQIKRFFDRISTRFENNFAGKRIAVWGLAFKPNTDDTREAPAFILIEKLLKKGAEVVAYDPEAKEGAMHRFGNKITYGENMYATLNDANALIIATEWNEFRSPDFAEVKRLLREPIIFDGRNVYDIEKMQKLGMEYYSVGRRSILPE